MSRAEKLIQGFPAKDVQIPALGLPAVVHAGQIVLRGLLHGAGGPLPALDPVVPANQENEGGHGQQEEGEARPAVPFQPEDEKDEGRQGGGGPQPGAAGKPGVQRGELPLAGGDAGPIQVGRQDRSALSEICQIPT